MCIFIYIYIFLFLFSLLGFSLDQFSPSCACLCVYNFYGLRPLPKDASLIPCLPLSYALIVIVSVCTVMSFTPFLLVCGTYYYSLPLIPFPLLPYPHHPKVLAFLYAMISFTGYAHNLLDICVHVTGGACPLVFALVLLY